MNKHPYVGIIWFVIIVCVIIFIAQLFPRQKPTVPTYKIQGEEQVPTGTPEDIPCTVADCKG